MSITQEEHVRAGEYGRIGQQPRLSLFIGARNDGYQGNFNWRLETTLNYLAHSLETLRRLDDVEVVVADWGSETPVHTTLSLSRAAKQIVRFVIVPLELARELVGENLFPIVLAQNTAVRRCRGEFIAQTDSDVLFTTEFLARLFQILDAGHALGTPIDRAFVFSGRRTIPWEYVARSPDIRDLDWLVSHVGRFMAPSPWFRADSGVHYRGTSFVMMHRDIWNDCQGYDERLVYWGWMDIDLALRVRQKYPWLDLQTAGMPMPFHMEHFPPASDRGASRGRNPMWRDNLYRQNGEAWGLGRYTLREHAHRNDTDEIGEPGRVRGQGPRLNLDLLLTAARLLRAAAWRWINGIPFAQNFRRALRVRARAERVIHLVRGIRS